MTCKSLQDHDTNIGTKISNKERVEKIVTPCSQKRPKNKLYRKKSTSATNGGIDGP